MSAATGMRSASGFRILLAPLCRLANFWQDVSRDLEKGRLYIPLESLRMPRPFRGRHRSAALRFEIRSLDAGHLIARTRLLFAEGAPLQNRVDARLRVDLDLFGRGGLAVLAAIEKQGFNTLERRPAIDSLTRLALLARAVTTNLGAMISSTARREAATPRRFAGCLCRA